MYELLTDAIEGPSLVSEPVFVHAAPRELVLYVFNGSGRAELTIEDCPIQSFSIEQMVSVVKSEILFLSMIKLNGKRTRTYPLIPEWDDPDLPLVIPPDSCTKLLLLDPVLWLRVRVGRAEGLGKGRAMTGLTVVAEHIGGPA